MTTKPYEAHMRGFSTSGPFLKLIDIGAEVVRLQSELESRDAEIAKLRAEPSVSVAKLREALVISHGNTLAFIDTNKYYKRVQSLIDAAVAAQNKETP